MSERPRQIIVRYSVAVAAVLVVTLLKHYVINLLVGDQQWFLLYVAAICLSSWYGGFGPGIVTAMLSTLFAALFFASPNNSLAAPSSLFQLMLFLLEGLLVVGFTGNLRETRIAAEKDERAKDEALAMLDTFQVYAPVGLAFLDNELRYIRINYAMAELDGLTPAAHIGRTLQEVQPQLNPELQAGIQQVLETGKPLLDQELTIVKPTLLGMKKQHLLTSYYRIRGIDGQPLGIGAVMVDMTQYKAAEEAIRESEARFRIMADTAPVMIWLADAHQLRTYFNRIWFDFTGRTPEEDYGNGWTQNLHPDDVKPYLDVYSEAFDSRAEFNTEYRLRRKDGEYRWLISHGVPRFTPAGEFAGFIGISIDITERKQQEMAQAFVLGSGVLLSSSLDYETTLKNIARLAVPTMADWCAVDLLTPEKTIKRVAVTHVEPEKEKWAYELQERFPTNLNATNGVGRVIRTGETEFVADVPALLAPIYDTLSDEAKQVMDRLQAVSVITTPLTVRGSTIGALTFATAESKRHYTETDVRTAEQLATRMALAIDNSRLYREAEAERERFRVTLASIGDAVIATDALGQISFMNRIAEDLTGWSRDDTLGKPLGNIFNIVNETTRQPVENPVNRVLQEGRIVGLANHTVLISKSGGETPIDDSGSPIPGENDTVGGVVLVFRDVSERKRAERRQQFLVEASNLLISSLDYDTTLQQIVKLAVPSLADWAVIYLVNDDNSVRQAAVHHSDPKKIALREEMNQRYSPAPGHIHGYPRVIITGKAELLNQLADDIENIARDEEHLRYLRALNYTSSITVPLKNTERTFGAFALAMSESGRVFDDNDLALLEELGKLASLAIENARLYRQARGND